MMRCSIKLIVPISFLLIVCSFSGCSNSEQKRSEEYFIKVGGRGITVSDFNTAFEIAKAAYSYNSVRQPGTLREARLRLIGQMIEEMLVLERAKELGIEITKMEVEQAAENIKGDYPDTVFQQMLFEYAVSYHTWEKRLETRLLMEKVIAEELGNQVEITPDDIANYGKERSKDDEITSEVEEGSKDTDEIIIKNLRRKKMEKSYSSWIKKLKKIYPVEINKELWGKIDGIVK
ncbi:MAG: SurA N-terminal domain-containing protein [Deltaproteobacteria bacterium]|jgi:hypothetical protein|nr:SurA N-terminal domain-containing protein [Deltaproteobacteria bacterium]MBW2712052.1 SurA N-terminal domain-containing protein [Deltaproteobacteria bacterium]